MKIKILAIATNSNPELGKGKRTGLWLSELTHFVDGVQRAGYIVDIASPLGGKIPLDVSSISVRNLKDPANINFLADSRLKSSLENSLKIKNINVKDYVAIYLSGGHGTMWDFRQSKALQQKLTEFWGANKILSGVCHGVAGFIDTVDKDGKLIVKGKRVTGFSNLEDQIGGSKKYMPFLLEDDFKKNGALYRKNFFPFTSRVEVEPNFITGQNPQSAKDVAKAVVKMLADLTKIEKV